MLLSQKPVSLVSVPPDKLIIISKPNKNNQSFLYYTYLDQRLMNTTLQTRLIDVYYQQQRSPMKNKKSKISSIINVKHCIQENQTFVCTLNTFQIFRCDWVQQPQIIKIVFLQNQLFSGSKFNFKNSCWDVFGIFNKYGEKRLINYIQLWHIPQQPFAFIENLEVTIQKEKLYLFIHDQNKTQMKSIRWKDRVNVLQTLRNMDRQAILEEHQSSESKEWQSVYEKKDITITPMWVQTVFESNNNEMPKFISVILNNYYVLVIDLNKFKVTNSFPRPNIIYFRNNLIIHNPHANSKQSKGGIRKIQMITADGQIVDIGKINTFQGDIYSCRIFSSKTEQQEQNKCEQIKCFQHKQQNYIIMCAYNLVKVQTLMIKQSQIQQMLGSGVFDNPKIFENRNEQQKIAQINNNQKSKQDFDKFKQNQIVQQNVTSPKFMQIHPVKESSTFTDYIKQNLNEFYQEEIPRKASERYIYDSIQFSGTDKNPNQLGNQQDVKFNSNPHNENYSNRRLNSAKMDEDSPRKRNFSFSNNQPENRSLANSHQLKNNERENSIEKNNVQLGPDKDSSDSQKIGQNIKSLSQSIDPSEQSLMRQIQMISPRLNQTKNHQINDEQVGVTFNDCDRNEKKDSISQNPLNQKKISSFKNKQNMKQIPQEPEERQRGSYPHFKSSWEIQQEQRLQSSQNHKLAMDKKKSHSQQCIQERSQLNKQIDDISGSQKQKRKLHRTYSQSQNYYAQKLSSGTQEVESSKRMRDDHTPNFVFEDMKESNKFSEMGQNWNIEGKISQRREQDEVSKQQLPQSKVFSNASQDINNNSISNNKNIQSKNSISPSITSIMSRSQSQKLSQKVKVFSMGRYVTPYLKQVIQKQKYSFLMMDIFQKKPEKFQQSLQNFIKQILQQDQASQLFYVNLKSTTYDRTKDKIKRIYLSIENHQQYKQKMVRALRDFKFSETPGILLPFDQTATKILQMFASQIYMEQISQPSNELITQLTENYMKQQPLPIEFLTIEDQMIDITHPRNFLNVLLYLNQYFKLPLENVITSYCQVLLKHKQIQIIRKLINVQKIHQLCSFDSTIFEKCIINYLIKYTSQLESDALESLQEENSEFLLQKSFIDYGNIESHKNYIEEVMELIPKTYQIGQNSISQTFSFIINYFRALHITFPLSKVFMIYRNNSIYVFLKEYIIKRNSAKRLHRLKLPIVYRKLHSILDKNELNFYTYELIQLIKKLADKLIQSGYYKIGFQMLIPIYPLVRKSFIGMLLIKYFKGKFSNRLIKTQSKNITSLVSLFPQIISKHNQSQQPRQQKDFSKYFRSDILITPQHSDYFNCSWGKFSDLFGKHFISKSQQMKRIVFLDPELAYQISGYQIQQLNGLDGFLKMMKKYQTRQINCISLHQLTKISKQVTNIDLISDQSIGNAFDSKLFIQSQALSPFNNELQRAIQIKSLANFQFIQSSQKNDWTTQKKTKNTLGQMNGKAKISRCLSQQRDLPEQIQKDPQLSHLRILVNKSEIFGMLQQIFNDSPTQKFLKAVNMLGKQKVHLHHFQAYRLIATLPDFNSNASLVGILPFEIFMIANPSQCFDLIHSRLLTEISSDNFWVIFMIIEVMFSKGNQLASLLIEKIIKYDRDDQHGSQIVEYLLNYDTKSNMKYQESYQDIEGQDNCTEHIQDTHFRFNFESSFIYSMIEQAQSHDLSRISMKLQIKLQKY